MQPEKTKTNKIDPFLLPGSNNRPEFFFFKSKIFCCKCCSLALEPCIVIIPLGFEKSPHTFTTIDTSNIICLPGSIAQGLSDTISKSFLLWALLKASSLSYHLNPHVEYAAFKAWRDIFDVGLPFSLWGNVRYHNRSFSLEGISWHALD